jgi:hypothetical protein
MRLFHLPVHEWRRQAGNGATNGAAPAVRLRGALNLAQFCNVPE